MPKRCRRDPDFRESSCWFLEDSAHQQGNIDRFILSHRWCIAYDLIPRPQAKLARHLRILPTKHLSVSSFRQLECFSSADPLYFGQTTRILSPKICHLGELALVLELDCQSFGCLGGNAISKLGSSIHLGYSAAMVYTNQPSTDACTLCQGKSGAVHYLGNRL